jgi:hypothetical protein
MKLFLNPLGRDDATIGAARTGIDIIAHAPFDSAVIDTIISGGIKIVPKLLMKLTFLRFK